MTDIVERLREGITLYSAALENSDKHMDLLSEAADEIEQLRNKIAYSTALAEEAVVLIENLKAERDAAVKLLQELRSWHLNGNDDSEGRELIDAYLKARGEK